MFVIGGLEFEETKGEFGLSISVFIFTKNEKLMRKHVWLNNLKMFSKKFFQIVADIFT